MKRAFISGVSGLIGSHLADVLLEKGYFVFGTDNFLSGSIDNIKNALKNKNFVFKNIDVLDKEKLFRAVSGKKFDVVIHMAASKKIGESGSRLGVLLNNTASTLNLMELARRLGAKFVFASTSDVYGMSDKLPFNEEGNSVLGPSSIKRWSYAVSKLYSEHLVFGYVEEMGLKAVILRYFGCFGARANKSASGGHIPLFMAEALKGGTITIHGDGKQTRSMAYITDIIDGTIRAIENKKAVGEIINIGSREEVRVKDSAIMILRAARGITPRASNTRIEYVPMKKVFGNYREISRRVPDLGKAKALLGYVPHKRLKEAVEMALKEMASDKTGGSKR